MSENSVRNAQRAKMVGIRSETLTPTTRIIRISGYLDADAGGAALRTLAGELIGAAEVVVLDVRAVSAIDGAGLHALHVAAELTFDEDIWLCLVDTPDGAVRVRLAEEQAAEVFEIFSSVTEALRHSP